MTEDASRDAKVEGEAPAFALIALMLATFLALCGASLLLPHDRYVRYQQMLPTIQFRAVWGYERRAFDETPIDVAIIGNSRLQSAVSAPRLREELTRRLGRPINVANLSMPQEGRDVHYVIAKHLVETHPEVQLVVLSAIEQMPREGHPAFPTIADTEDVLRAPMVFNTAYFHDLVSLPYRQMSLFVQSQFSDAFGVTRAFDAAVYAGPDYDSTASFETPTGNYVDRDRVLTREELLPTARARIEGITPPLLPESMQDYEFAIERRYTSRISDMMQANGTQLAFLYTPVFNYPEPVHSESFYSERGPLLEANFMAQDPRNYSDYGHSNRIGTARVTEWLAGQIVSEGLLEAGQSPAAPEGDK